jgi:chemotaxis protein methyltransferase CheR
LITTTLPAKHNPAAPPASLITAENYAFLQSQVYRDSGIVLDETKLYLIESRLMPIVQKQKLQSLNDLCALLRAVDGSALRQQVVEAMTTNETLFFRDVAAFDALQKIILPELIEARKATRILSFWSAAASSGQEAYSLAMMLLEMGLTGWKIRILGTDLNGQILDRARAGRYLQIEVNRGLPAKLLVKYFQRAGLEWQIKDEVRRMVDFRPFDLRMSMRSMGPFDLIFCRNVLIYFDTETKKRILAELRGALFNKGLLMLGAAESTFNLDDQFARKSIGQATFYQAP